MGFGMTAFSGDAVVVVVDMADFNGLHPSQVYKRYVVDGLFFFTKSGIYCPNRDETVRYY
jgi:hypothetical protein